jgi:putative sterol carrier protein
MGFYSRAAIVSGPGAVVGDGKSVPLAEEVSGHFDEIASLENPREYNDLTSFMGSMLEAFSAGSSEAKEPAGLTVEAVFEQMPNAFRADKAGGVDVVFQYSISGEGGGDWQVVIKNGECQVTSGKHEAPTTTIKMSADDFLAMISGSLNPMQAYTSGKLKIEGDLMKSQLIEKLFKF